MHQYKKGQTANLSPVHSASLDTHTKKYYAYIPSHIIPCPRIHPLFSFSLPLQNPRNFLHSIANLIILKPTKAIP